jgi:NADPH-dependent curcumin reductase CurA
MEGGRPELARARCNRQVRVTTRAQGIPSEDVFTIETAAIPEVTPGGLLVRVLYASVDPAMRGWVSEEKNYLTVPTGSVMPAHGVAEVIASDNPDWRPGDHVYGWFGWQQYAAVSAADVWWRIDLDLAPATAWLGVLGLNGLTAWVGFHHLARPRRGETVLVSSAAGAVGGVVGQLARAAGLRAVGLTGGDAKVAQACAELGYDAALNYRSADDLGAAIGAACPDGINIFFDNTAGAIADAVFPHLAAGARVVQCGTASISTWLPVPHGPRRERDMLVKRLLWHGFVLMDHADLFPQALGELGALFAAGAITARDHILDGLDHAPGAIAMLYRGENSGRLLIRP